MQYSVGAAPASMSLPTTLATEVTTEWNRDISRVSEMLGRFDATQPGCVRNDVTGEPASRRRRSNSKPHNITASFERPYAGRDDHFRDRRCGSSNAIEADLWASEPTLMIFERTRSNSRLVNANGPRKFVPIVISKPSTVSLRFCATMPALLIRMSTSPVSRSGNARTDDW